MCTVALVLGRFPGAPLVVAANRDERLDRASEGPRLRPGASPVVAPRDLVAGGTWWAVAPSGLIVAITNRFGVPVDPDRASRGTLVDAVVRRGSFDAAIEFALSLAATAWNGFHLAVAQGARGFVVVGDGERLSGHGFGPGVRVVSERSFGAAPGARDAVVADRLEGRLGTRPDPAALLEVLSGHGEGFEGPCIHAPALNYGTRSSAVIIPDGPERRLVYSDGAPCSSAHVEATHLLGALRSAEAER